jgi:hypothetical protein
MITSTAPGIRDLYEETKLLVSYLNQLLNAPAIKFAFIEGSPHTLRRLGPSSAGVSRAGA